MANEFLSGYLKRRYRGFVANDAVKSNWAKLIVGYAGAGTDADGLIYNLDCRSDFNDFALARFESGTNTRQKEWREKYTSGTSADKWFKVSESYSSVLTGNAASGQKVVDINDASGVAADDWCVIARDDGTDEFIQIDSISTNEITFKTNLVNAYTTADNAKVMLGYYICYDDADDATDYQDGANTFIHFDDFERGSDGDEVGGNWVEAAGTVEISTGQHYSGSGSRSMKLVGQVGNVVASHDPVTASESIAIRYRVYKEGAAGGRILWHDVGASGMVLNFDSSENIRYWNGGTYADTGHNCLADAWGLLEVNNFNFTAKSNEGFYNGVSFGNVMFDPGAGPVDKVAIYGDGGAVGRDIWIDDFIVRNYPDIAGAGFGSEEVEIINKNSSDTGSGTDTKKSGNPLAFLSRSETGSGAESLPAKSSMAVQEGSGSDLATLLATFTGSDSGAGSDVLTGLLALFLLSESGAGVESIPLRNFLINESGAGVETLGERILSALDTGIAVDIARAFLEKYSSDAGICSLENSYLKILESVKESSDTGSGVDASAALQALFELSDSGSGLDAVIARALYSREYPGGALDFAKLVTATLAGEDSGSGAESSMARFELLVSETGTGTELATLQALFSDSDSGAGVEALTLLATMIASDSGIGVEQALNRMYKLFDTGEGVDMLKLLAHFVQCSDTGTGTETVTSVTMQLLDAGVGIESILSFYKTALESGVGLDTVAEFARKALDSGIGAEIVQLLGLIGRAMKVKTYTRPYYNVKTYTRKYYNVKTYTNEVRK